MSFKRFVSCRFRLMSQIYIYFDSESVFCFDSNFDCIACSHVSRLRGAPSNRSRCKKNIASVSETSTRQNTKHAGYYFGKQHQHLRRIKRCRSAWQRKRTSRQTKNHIVLRTLEDSIIVGRIG